MSSREREREYLCGLKNVDKQKGVKGGEVSLLYATLN